MRSFVYVFPARGEAILKLGMSRDPFTRLRSFHPRYYEFFELESGYLISAVDTRDARRIERALGAQLIVHNARLSPLEVRRSAGGHTEWYRGAATELRVQAEALVGAGGYWPIIALDEWIRKRLIADAALLYEWSGTMLDGLDATADTPQAIAIECTLRDALDAYSALGLDVHPHLSPDASAWYAAR